MKTIKSIVAIIVSTSMLGCATIFKGSSAEVRFNSSPSGAEVLVDEVNRGETPTAANLARDTHHKVTFKKEGYEDVTFRIRKKFDGATVILGNIVSWALLGIVVDFASGAAYSLSPADLEANMEEMKAAGIIDPNQISISKNAINVIMITKEEWQKIND